MAVSLDVLTAARATAASGGAAIAAIDAVDDETRHWDTAAGFASDLLPALVAAPPATVFNLNVPDAPRAAVRGLRRAPMAPFGQVQVTIAEVGQGFVRTALEEAGPRPDDGTDVACLAAGYAAVTPLRGISESPDPLDLPVDGSGQDAGVHAG
jgi:5'-nucleotidase